ncbi:MAG: ATP-binding protein [Desulforhopalus sp.]|nr:ATP-binding protein [Desulforhopalus sp.]
MSDPIEQKTTATHVADSKEIPLIQGPSMSIRVKVTISFSLFFILSAIIIGWSYGILTKLEHKIEFLEISGKYMVEIQQARRFEKNYLLYSTNLDDALTSLKKADAIVTSNSDKIEKILSQTHYTTMVSYMEKYHNQLLLVSRVENNRNRELLVPQLRKFGSQMVDFGSELVQKEQNSVKRMFLLARRIPLYFMSALFILMTFVLFFLMRQLIVTLKRFMDYTVRIGEGDFSPILWKRKYRDEFSQLAEAFNHMTRELDHNRQVIVESQKLRAIGTLVAGVAHELNNPLNNTLLTASMLTEDFKTLSDEEKLEMVDDIVNETERSRLIVKNLLDFAREGETQRTLLEVDKIVRESTRLVANQVKLAKVNLIVKSEKDLPLIYGDQQKLKQVFVNLILNALDALETRGTGGDISINVKHGDRPDRVFITVHDNGPGIPEDIQDRIFDPFFTTKALNKGTGLGLSVSRGIIVKLGGKIRLDSAPGKGTTFIISLPTSGGGKLI